MFIRKIFISLSLSIISLQVINCKPLFDKFLIPNREIKAIRQTIAHIKNKSDLVYEQAYGTSGIITKIEHLMPRIMQVKDEITQLVDQFSGEDLFTLLLRNDQKLKELISLHGELLNELESISFQKILSDTAEISQEAAHAIYHVLLLRKHIPFSDHILSKQQSYALLTIRSHLLTIAQTLKQASPVVPFYPIARTEVKFIKAATDNKEQFDQLLEIAQNIINNLQISLKENGETLTLLQSQLSELAEESTTIKSHLKQEVKAQCHKWYTWILPPAAPIILGKRAFNAANSKLENMQVLTGDILRSLTRLLSSGCNILQMGLRLVDTPQTLLNVAIVRPELQIHLQQLQEQVCVLSEATTKLAHTFPHSS